ncbi:hypothetical protein CBM2606_A140262 [Cupriavidus taiwanensis]|nr:hypothetical protein CBM2606_A140262 [Cupriavidus taiwanensis]
MRAIHLDDSPLGRIPRQARSRQLATPDATRIQRHQVRPHDQAQRRPVPADHRYILGAPPRHIEPWHEPCRRLARAVLGLEVHHPVDRAVAQAGEGIHHHAEAVDAAQAVVPAVRRVAEDVGEEALPVGALELFFDFIGKVDHLGCGPLGQHTGVDQQEVVFQQGKRAVAQPGEQIVTVRGGEDVAQSVVAAFLAYTGGDCEKVDIVVAKDGFGTIAHGAYGAQGCERGGATVDEIADQAHGRLRRQAGEQGVQRRCATLQITDCVK